MSEFGKSGYSNFHVACEADQLKHFVFVFSGVLSVVAWLVDKSTLNPSLD